MIEPLIWKLKLLVKHELYNLTSFRHKNC